MRTFFCLALSALVLVAPFSPSRARVDVYRCVLEGGTVSYQQFPCSNESKPLLLKDRQSGWSPLRPGEQDLLKSYRIKDAERRRKSAGQSKKSVIDNKDCWNKRQQLEAVRSKLHRGYKLKEGDALHRKRDRYEDYLRQFCS